MREIRVADTFRRVLIYSNPKCGKTRLACSYPEEWGKGVYVAAEPCSEDLGPVQFELRKRLMVIKPLPEDPKKKIDPLFEAVAIANKDWSADGYGVLIWDSLTSTAIDLLAAYALKGNYAKDQITYGEVGTPTHHCHATMGDFGAAQSSVLHLLRFLFKQKVHVIVLAHQSWAEPKSNDGGTIIGGPATIGGAQIKEIGGLFPSVVHLDVKTVRTPNEPAITKFIAHNNKAGIWLSGTRTGGDSLPDIDITNNPKAFWDAWLVAVNGMTK